MKTKFLVFGNGFLYYLRILVKGIEEYSLAGLKINLKELSGELAKKIKVTHYISVSATAKSSVGIKLSDNKDQIVNGAKGEIMTEGFKLKECVICGSENIFFCERISSSRELHYECPIGCPISITKGAIRLINNENRDKLHAYFEDCHQRGIKLELVTQHNFEDIISLY